MSTGHGPVKKSMWTSYELRWEPKSDDFLGQTGDFLLTQDLSRWLFDLVRLNTDDLSKVEKDWWIFHTTPGHIFIFLHLVASDLLPRIQYPLKKPGSGWTSSPLPSAICTEHRYRECWDFQVKIQEMRCKPALSQTHLRIVHHPDKGEA